MKIGKKKDIAISAINQPPIASEVSVMQRDFKASLENVFPDEFADEEANKVLWACFCSGAAMVATQIGQNAAMRFASVAQNEFKKAAPQAGTPLP